MRIAKSFILPLQIFATNTNNTTFSQNSRNNRRIWGTLAAPVVAYSEKKNIRMSYVNSKVCWFTWGSPNPLFYRCKFSWRLQTILLFHKTRTKLAASERDWRLPSSPIVRQKHKDLLCKLKSVLIYTRIAKPFILPLQMFAFTKVEITFSNTRTKLADTQQHCRLPSSPIVRKEHKDFLCKLKNVCRCWCWCWWCC